MTEGIIQKVFGKYADIAVTNSEHHDSIMKRVEQELIAEIKKEFPNCHWNGTEWIIQKLIGDNQE